MQGLKARTFVLALREHEKTVLCWPHCAGHGVAHLPHITGEQQHQQHQRTQAHGQRQLSAGFLGLRSKEARDVE